MIILLSGKRFSGKDTIASFIPELKRISVADTMKIEFMKQHPTINLFDREQKEKHRHELVEFTHKYDLMHWLEKTPYQDNMIVTDIRTKLEIRYICEKFNSQIIVVRLNVTDESRAKRGWVYDKEYDESYLETELDDCPFDLVLNNNQKVDIPICVDSIRQLLKNGYFIDVGCGFRRTKTPFHDVPLFCNYVPLLADKHMRKHVVKNITDKIEKLNLYPTHVLAIESGGYPLGAFIASELDLGFTMTRKPDKLPPPVIKVNYTMEYRPSNEMEIQADCFNYENARVIIVDDVLATGGTLKAAIELVKKTGSTPICVVSFADLDVNDKSYVSTFDIPVVTHMQISNDKIILR